jgi:hypothetical protein
MNAVVDRITGEFAVVLLGTEEHPVAVPVKNLPAGIVEGTWLDVSFSINRKLTDEHYRKNRELLDKIRRKKKG